MKQRYQNTIISQRWPVESVTLKIELILWLCQLPARICTGWLPDLYGDKQSQKMVDYNFGLKEIISRTLKSLPFAHYISLGLEIYNPIGHIEVYVRLLISQLQKRKRICLTDNHETRNKDVNLFWPFNIFEEAVLYLVEARKLCDRNSKVYSLVFKFLS